MNEGLSTPDVKALIAKLGAVSPLGSPADFAKFIADQNVKWQGVAKAANIKIN
jgi:tripartite-type tricarboxylate transporter receptor subunit TctC